MLNTINTHNNREGWVASELIYTELCSSTTAGMQHDEGTILVSGSSEAASLHTEPRLGLKNMLVDALCINQRVHGPGLRDKTYGVTQAHRSKNTDSIHYATVQTSQVISAEVFSSFLLYLILAQRLVWFRLCPEVTISKLQRRTWQQHQ